MGSARQGGFGLRVGPGSEGGAARLSEPPFPRVGSDEEGRRWMVLRGGACLSFMNSVVIHWAPLVCCAGHKGYSSGQDSTPSWGSEQEVKPLVSK